MNPRAAINDLLPFQGSPFGQLGYFSELRGLLYQLFPMISRINLLETNLVGGLTGMSEDGNIKDRKKSVTGNGLTFL